MTSHAPQSARIVVLGGGMIGSTIAADLTRIGCDVTVADMRRHVLDALAAALPVRVETADLRDRSALTSLLARHDLVVGALPSDLGFQMLEVVLDAGQRYCDISFMPEDASALASRAERAGAAAVVDCGVAPGLSNVLAGIAAARLTPCSRLDIMVGGLPLDRSAPFEYKAGFAPADVLEEYTRPARIVEDGQQVTKEALSEPQPIEVPGVGLLEAFNTDGLRSLMHSLRVPNMRERTLRYPGHCAQMRTLRDVGFFSKEPVTIAGPAGPQLVRPIDLTSALLFPHWSFRIGEPDVTVLRVTAEGIEGTIPTRHVWELVDRYDPESQTRSMSRTTGYAASAMVALMLAGFMTSPGVHVPEELATIPGAAERYLDELALRGIHITHRSEMLGTEHLTMHGL